MQELLDLILKNIVTHPEAIEITPSTEEGRDIYTIKVDPEDMGRVIGKNGKVIKAIRALAHVVAIRQGKRFRINLADEAGNTENLADTESDPKVEPKTEDISDVIDLSEDTPEEKVKE